MTRNEAEKILKEHGQEHVLRHFDDLSVEAQEGLLTQISEVNWDDLALAGVQEKVPVGEISPLSAVDIDEINARRAEFEEAGYEAIRAGKVAALLLAGGNTSGVGQAKGRVKCGHQPYSVLI